MTDSVTLKLTQLKKLQETLHSNLKKCHKDSADVMTHHRVNQDLHIFQTMLDSTQLELSAANKSTPGHAEAVKQLREFKTAGKDLASEFAKIQLFHGAGSNGAASAPTVTNGPSPSEQVMKKSLQTQSSGLSSLRNSLRMIHECQEIGTTTVTTLHEQSHQVAKIAHNLEEVGTDLDRSVKIVKRMQRRM